MRPVIAHKVISLLMLLFLLMGSGVFAQFPEPENDTDRKVLAFLKNQAGEWRDMNVPATDGRILYDLVVEGNYHKVLEIGTSTGHSAIWIAWALTKTGGKLVTIEIEKQRYLQALQNFRKAGLSDYIDARLGDAHELVPALDKGWDFVFCDADKYWYKNYFTAMETKINKGGCFAAHNINTRSPYIKEFIRYVQAHPGFSTGFRTGSRAGISVSYRK